MIPTPGHRYTYRKVSPREATRFKVHCGVCGKPATLAQHDHYHQQGSDYLFFYYYCAEHDPRLPALA